MGNPLQLLDRVLDSERHDAQLGISGIGQITLYIRVRSMSASVLHAEHGSGLPQ